MRALASVVLLVAAGCVNPDKLEAPKKEGPKSESTDMVRTTHGLLPGQTIGPNDIEVVRYPKTLISPRAFSSADEVIGRTVRHRLAPHEVVTSPVLDRVIIDRISSQIPAGRRSVHVPTDAALTVGGHADIWISERGEGCTIAQGATVVGLRKGRAELAVLPSEAFALMHHQADASFTVTARRDGDNIVRPGLTCSF